MSLTTHTLSMAVLLAGVACISISPAFADGSANNAQQQNAYSYGTQSGEAGNLNAQQVPAANNAVPFINPDSAAVPTRGTLRQPTPAELGQAEPASANFLSGGVGAEGRALIEAEQNNYDLKLTFAATKGNYLSGVAVKIYDSKGNLAVDTVTTGPVLLSRLSPGTYTVNADFEGQTKKQKITVGSQGLTAKAMFFNMSES